MIIEVILFILNIFNMNSFNILFSIILYLHIFIIAVLFYVKCKNYSKLYVISSFIIKTIFLIIIFKFKNEFGLKFNLIYAFLSFLIILIYNYTHDINKEYNCDIKKIDLIKSIIFTSISYFFFSLFI